MATVIKVLLIEDNRIEARQTQHWLVAAQDPPCEVECVETLQAGIARLALGGIDIVLLDLNLPDSRGLDSFVLLHDRSPQTPVVVLTGEYDESTGAQAVEKGAQDYLVKNQIDAHTLVRNLRYALARHRAQQETTEKSRRGRNVRVLGFIGAKGGTGTTTTALNIAVALSLKGKDVILVELRSSFGTLSCQLNRNPQSNLRSLLELPAERIGVTDLDPVLCQSQADLRILFGPQESRDAKEIDPQQVEAIIKGLSTMADYVVLDLPNQPTTATQAAVRLCHFVAVVTECEPSAVMAGKITISQLQSWGVGGDSVGAIVVNQTVYPIPMAFSDIQAGLGCAIVGIVPWAATACMQALREGSPLTISQPDHDASYSLVEIAEKIAVGKAFGVSR